MMYLQSVLLKIFHTEKLFYTERVENKFKYGTGVCFVVTKVIFY